jgi:hypothetical protein
MCEKQTQKSQAQYPGFSEIIIQKIVNTRNNNRDKNKRAVFTNRSPYKNIAEPVLRQYKQSGKTQRCISVFGDVFYGK